MTVEPRFRALLLGLAIVALTTLAYSPGLGGGFLFDDYPQIVHQEAIHLESVDLDSVARALRGFRHGVGRPLPMLSFAVDYHIWGRTPFGYKVSSLLVHIGNALLVLMLLRRLLAISVTPDPPRALLVAALLSAAWALHPLQVSTVLYVVQRMETMSLFFVLLALIAYVSGRERQIRGQKAWHILLACPPLVGLGMACKETAALFPAYALALELTVLGFRARSASTASAWRISHTLIAGLSLAAAAILLPIYADATLYAIRDYTALERVLTQLRVLPMYLGWILWPDPGAYLFYYDQYEASRGLMQPASTTLGLLLLIGLGGSALWWRRQVPLYALGILWFFAAHAITSSFLPLELVFEHRNYFATLGVLVAAYALVARIWQEPVSPRLPFGVALVVLSGLAGLTVLRASAWGDPVHLAMELAQINPTSPRAGTGLGDQYLLLSGTRPNDPFLQLAEKEYERAAALPGASPIPEQGLLIMAAQLGRPARDDWWTSLLAKLANRPIGPQEMAVVTSLLDLRNSGLPIDDRRLADAYMVLSRRMTLPPTQYFAFAMHALVDLDDRQTANELLAMSVDHASGNELLLHELEAHLRDQGFPDAADFLRSYARTTQVQAGSQ